MEAFFAVAIVGLFGFWVGQLKHEISAITAGGTMHQVHPTVHRIIAEPSHQEPREATRPATQHVAGSDTAHTPKSHIRRVNGTGIPTWTIE